ncbi:MAG: hypothetical protein QHH07_05300 [Sedimentisphaerales bacterium]|nr:hypothetical protein [Sedimentisphaerales bacterium]
MVRYRWIAGMLVVVLPTLASYSMGFPADLVLEGAKAEYRWPLKELDPNMPSDWSQYRYLVLELRSSTAQRFSIWIHTRTGGRRLMFHPFGQDIWIRAAIPLDFFRGMGRQGSDLASAHNRRFESFWVGLWGPFGDLKDVEAIGLVMDYPVGRPRIQIRSIYLVKEDPGSRFLEGPVVDQFGQSAKADWPEKVRSREQLEQELNRELQTLDDSSRFNYCQFGGYKHRQYRATGFFRVEQIDGRWWFIDPDGHPFLSVGANCISDRSGNDLALRRMTAWGVNTIGSWSSIVQREGVLRKAYTVMIRSPRFKHVYLGMPDVYAPDFEQTLRQEIARQCSTYRKDQWLLGYFLGNEPPWPGRESEVVDLFLQGPDCATRQRLHEYLAGGDSPMRRRAFVHQMFKRYLDTMIDQIKHEDPNHLILGIRFGGSPDQEVLQMARSFDVCSINVYEYEPTSQIESVYRATGRPVLIGEFHIGVPANGLAAGLVQAADQAERAKGYRYYVELAAALPAFVGAHWFQWADEPVLGRFDGENYNIGLVDVTNRPYKELIDAAIQTHTRLYEVHSGLTKPFDQRPKASEFGTPVSPW